MARRRVGGGRLRVDAARAVAKLRDFQLWDPALWALEVARAAIALEGKAVHALGDADDVWVRWDGEPIADADMLSLFDELVSPVTDAARRPLRLLATGVNSALGAGTSFVDVWAFRPGAKAHRVRYTPSVLVVDDSSTGVATGLRKLRVDHEPPPRGAAAKGAAIHVRRSTSLAVLRRFISGSEPREIFALRHACEDAPVPVHVGRAKLGGGRSSFDLVRIALGPGLNGFLALTERAPASHDTPSALLDVGELGVHLASYPLDLGLGLARTPLPVRAWIDAPVMPTNASRSDVRQAEPPVAQAIDAARSRFPDLVAAICSQLVGEGAADAAARKAHERIRTAALRLIASFVGGALWTVAVRALADHAIAPLLAAPLVRDALGRPRSLAELARETTDDANEVPVHRGDEPVDARLEEWLGDVLWTPPGDASALVLGGTVPPDVRTHIKKAKSSMKARDAFRKRPKRAATIDDDARSLVAVRLDRAFAANDPWQKAVAAAGELRGELVLLAPEPGHRSGGRVELLCDGRMVGVEPLALGPPFVAVVEASNLRPSLDYRGIERGEALDATLRAVRAAVIRATEALARWMLGVEPEPFDARRGTSSRAPDEEGQVVAAEAVRHGLSDLLAFLADIGVEQDVDETTEGDEANAPKRERKLKKGQKAARFAITSSDSPLLEAAVWPMADGSWSSARGLGKLAPFGKPLGVIGRARSGRALPARPIVVADDRDAATLRRVLPRSVAVLSYDPAGAEAFDPSRVARDSLPERGAVLAVRERGRRGVIVWGGRKEGLEVRHANRILASPTRSSALAPCWIVIDDDDLVPMPGWQEVAGGAATLGALEPTLVDWEHRMLEAMARAELDQAPSRELLVHPYVGLRPMGEPLRRHLLTAITRRHPNALRGTRESIAAKLDDLALVPVARRGLVTLRALREEAAADALGFVPAESIRSGDEVDPGSWWVIGSEEDAQAIARATGREIPSASPRLEAIRAESRLRAAERAHAAKPKVALESPNTVASTLIRTGSKLRVSGEGIRDGFVAIPSRPADAAIVAVCLDARMVEELRLEVAPRVVAALDVDRSLVDADLAKLTPEGSRRVVRRLLDATSLVLEGVGAAEPTALVEDAAVAPVFRGFVTTKRPLELTTFAALPMFRSVQGARVSAKAAVRKGALQTARLTGEWLAPLASESATELDEPIIAVSSDADTWMLGQLTGARLADRSHDVAEMRAARRVARGLARRPYLPYGAPAALTVAVERLTSASPDLARIVGIGDVAIVEPGQGRASLYADGDLRHELVLADAFPGFAIRAALESPVVSSGAPSPERTVALERALALVAQRALVAVLQRPEAGTLPEWVRHAARSVWSRGETTSRDALRDFACLPLTSGSWITPRQALAEVEARGELWFTTDALSRTVPDDATRPVVKLDLAFDPEIVTRERTPMQLWNVTEDLRNLEISRHNRQRPAARRLELGADAATGALGQLALVGDGTNAPRGLVAPLLPNAAKTRILRPHRLMVPFAEIADPCEWPTVAAVDDARLTPTKLWDRIEEDAWLGALREQVRAASEQAIAARFLVPTGAVALRIDSVLSREAVPDRGVVLRGVLWIDGILEPAERIAVIGADGTAYRSVAVKQGDERKPLPLRGTLLVHCVRDTAAIEPALAKVARLSYARLVMDALGSGALEPDATAAHVVTALSTGALGPKDVRGRSETLACTRPPLALSGLSAILKARDPILMQSPDESPWQSDKGRLVVVSDGSLAATALLAAVADRVESTANLRDRRRLLAEREAEIASAELATQTKSSAVAKPSRTASAAKKAPAAATPTGAVLAALDKRIAALALASQHLEVVAASGKGRTVVRIEPSRLVVEVDLQSPLGRRLIAAQERRDHDAVADALDLLAAHVAGELDILYDSVKPEHHLRAVIRLLEPER